MMTSQRACRGLLLVALVAAGCVPDLPQGEPLEADREVPDGWSTSGGEDTGSAGGGAGESSRPSAQVDWREFFSDPHLVALIETALAQNQELNIMVQENLLASYEIMVRRGEYLPRLGVGASAGIERVGRNSSQGRSDEMAGLDEDLQDYRFGLSASWEIDVWRRMRNARDAAQLRYLATIEERGFMVTRLVAEIASLYYELLALDQQAEVVAHSIELQRDTLELLRLQMQAARATALAVSRFEAELADFESRQYDIRQRIVETENRINFLVGRFPQPVERNSGSFMETEPAVMRAGLPTELLENRPDVRAAELQMEAAELDVRSARARFYPALSLEAGVGYGSFDIRHLIDTPGSLLYNLFANLTAPLLNRNAITAGYYSADARQRQAVIGYERAILTAYMEVVNRLSLIENLGRSFEARARRVERLTDSIEISNTLFDSARADYLEVLTARRDSLDAQMELIETKQRQMTAAVRLYQALGGGWSREASARADARASADAGDDEGADADADAPR